MLIRMFRLRRSCKTGHPKADSKRTSQAGHKPPRQSERGNVFFTLFGAVAIVGVLGAGIMATMRGPLSTMVNVNRRTQAEAQMDIAAKLAMLESAALATADCEAVPDGYIEPLEYAVNIAGLAGGGTLPAAVGSTKIDPWGTDIGYCVWDLGPTIDDAGCGGAGQTRLAGPGVDDETYKVMAIISAGPDRTFQSTCGDDPAYVTKGGDDIVAEFTYADARGMTGGLWKLKSGQPDTAEIDKELFVSGGAQFTGNIDLTTSPSAQLQLGAASMLFPTDATLNVCNAANDGLLRVDTTTNPDHLQICDDPIGWVSVSAGAVGANLWTDLGSNRIHFGSSGTGQVGIANDNPAQALDITGNAQLSGDVMISNGQRIVWASGADITENTGAIELDANGGGGVELTVGQDIVGIGTAPVANNTLLVQGATADDTQNALSIRDSGATPLVVVQNDGDVGIGVVNPDDALDVSGSVDVSQNYRMDNITVLTDNGVAGNIIVGKSAGALTTGDYNTIVGSGAAGTLTTGTDNIIIGGGATPPDVPAATTSNYLNIGDLVHGDLTNNRLGIGYPAGINVLTFNDTLEINGTVDATGNINSDANLIAATDVTATAGDVTAGSQVIVNGDVLGPPPNCAISDKLEWNNGAGWSCEVDQQGGSGGSPPDFNDVLSNDPDALGLNAIGLGGIAVGSTVLSTGTATLEVDVTGDVGATQFCDDAGNNCFTAASITSGGGGLWTKGAADDIYYNSGATPRVGIGTATPSEALDVTGNINLTGELNHPGALTIRSTNGGAGTNTGAIFLQASPGNQDVRITPGDGGGDFNLFLQQGGGNFNCYQIFRDGTGKVRFDCDNDIFILENGAKLGIGDPTPDGALVADIEGDVGAIQYCDEFGLNCFTAASVSGGGDTSLVAYWALDDGSGTSAIDSSGNGHTGTLVNGPVWTTSGRLGGALSFDGVNDTVDIPDTGNAFDFGTGDFSAGAWIKTTTDCTSGDVFFARYTGTVLWQMDCDGAAAKATWLLRDSNSVIISSGSSTTTINDGAWHHLMGVKQGNTVLLYVDGVLENSGTGTFTGNFDTTVDVTIGRDGSDGRYINAVIDEVAVYRRALTAVEIKELYNIGTMRAAGADGEVQFNSGGELAANNNFFWDNVNNRLGIGTASPGYLLDVNGDIRTSNINMGKGKRIQLIESPTTNYLEIGNLSSTSTTLSSTYGIKFYADSNSNSIGGYTFYDNSGNKTLTMSNDDNEHIFYIDNVEYWRLTPTSVFMSGTGALITPRGDTSQRPASPVNGMLRYNSQTDKFEGYQGGIWTDIITAGGTAAAPDRGIQFNSGGVFYASSGLTYTSTGNLVISGLTTVSTNTQRFFEAIGADAKNAFFIDYSPDAGSGSTTSIGSDDAFITFTDESGCCDPNTKLYLDSTAGMRFNTNGSADYEFVIPSNSTHSLAFTNGGGWTAGRIEVTKASGSNNRGTIEIKTDVDNQLFLDSSANSGNVGIGTAAPGAAFEVASGDVIFSSTGALTLHSGDTSQRPAPVNGMLRYNSQTDKFEGVQGGIWTDIITAGGTPAAPDRGIQFNSGGTFTGDANFVYTSAGNLGIGTAAPVEMLDVAGSIQFSSGSTFKYGGYEILSVPEENSLILGLPSIQFYPGSFNQHSGVTGTANTILGAQSGANLTTGSFNTMIGYKAGGRTPSTSSYNVFIGKSAGFDVSGSSNVMIGFEAGGNTGAFATSNSIFIGENAGRSADSDRSVYIGYDAGNDSDGDNNIAIGYSTGSGPSTGTNNILLGYNIELPAAGTSNYLSIGNVITGDMTTATLTFNGTGAIDIPAGTTAERPTVPDNGMLRYNSDTNKFEGYQNNTWTDIITAGGTPAAPDRGIQFNSGGTFTGDANFVYTSAGNLGIGTAAPATTFELVDGGDSIQMASNPGGGVYLKMKNNTSTYGWSILDGWWAGDILTFMHNNSAVFNLNGNNGRIGIGTVSPQAQLDIAGTGALITPRGDTSQRPASPVNGMLRYNSDTNKFEGYQGGFWTDIITAGGTAAAPDRGIQFNSGGTFTGDANFVYTSTGRLGLGTTTTTNAVLSTSGMVGNTAAVFAQDTTGVAIIADFPEIGFNAYYNGGYKSIAAGYGADISMNPATGLLMFKTLSNAAGADQAMTDTTRMALTNAGRLGLGTSAPGSALHIVDPTGLESIIIEPSGAVHTGIVARADTSVKQTWYALEDTGSSEVTSFVLLRTSGNPAYVARNDAALYATKSFYIDAGGDFVSSADPDFTVRTDGKIGIGTASPGAAFEVASGDVIFSSTGALTLHSGDTSQRPSPAVNGMLRYNSQTDKFEGYQGGVWTDIITAGGTPAAPDRGIQFNSGGAFTAESGFSYTSTSQLTLGDGSTAAPPYTFGSDLDTGIYRIGANNMGFAAAGQNVFSAEYDGVYTSMKTSSIYAAHPDDPGFNEYQTAVKHNIGGTYDAAINAHKQSGGNTYAPIHSAVSSGSSANASQHMYGLITQRMNGNWNNTPIAMNAGEYLPAIAFAGQTDAIAGMGMRIGASIGAQVEGPVASGVLPTGLVFSTSKTDSTGLTERVRFTSAGRVGIGTATPGAALEVASGDVIFSSTGALTLHSGDTSQRPSPAVNGMLRYNSQTDKFEGYQGGVWTDIITAGGTAAAPDRGIQFNSGGAFTADANFVWTATGQLGIGTTSPTTALTVSGANKDISIFSYAASATDKGDLEFYRAQGTEAAPTVVNDGDHVGMIRFKPRNNIGSWKTNAEIYALVNDPTPGSDPITDLAFGLSSSGNGNATEIMRISAKQRIGILDPDPDAKLEISLDGSTGNVLMLSSDDNTDGDILIVKDSGNVGIGTASPKTNLDIAGTGAIDLPAGTDAERPVPADNGMLRYNSTSNKFEGFQAGSWQDIITAGGTAAAPDRGIQFNSGNAFAADANFTLTAAGRMVLKANIGTNNVFITGGNDTLTGIQSTFVGVNAGSGITGGSWNTAMGYISQQNTNSGDYNTSLGGYSLSANTNGNKNTAIGHASLYQATASDNTAVGADTLYSTVGGKENVAVGRGALFLNVTTDGNTAVGFESLYNSTGGTNTALGWKAGRSTTSGSGNILIGYNVNAPTATTSNYLNIGNILRADMATGVINFASSSAALTLPTGTGAQRPAPVDGMIRYKTDATVGFEVRESGAWVAMGAAVSDERLKTNIKPIDDAVLEKLAQIGTYSYQMKNDTTGRTRYGVIAQDVQKIFPELVDGSADDPDNMMSVRYTDFIAPLIAASKELKAENEALKAELETMKIQMAGIDDLRRDVKGLKAYTGYGINKAGAGVWILVGMGFMGLVFLVSSGFIRSRRRKG